MKLLFSVFFALLSFSTILRQSEALQGFGFGDGSLTQPTRIIPEGIPKTITQSISGPAVQSVGAVEPVGSKSSTKVTISASFQTIREPPN